MVVLLLILRVELEQFRGWLKKFDLIGFECVYDHWCVFAGGKDNCIRLWDIAKLIANERNSEDTLCVTTYVTILFQTYRHSFEIRKFVVWNAVCCFAIVSTICATVNWSIGELILKRLYKHLMFPQYWRHCQNGKKIIKTTNCPMIILQYRHSHHLLCARICSRLQTCQVEFSNI